ncbi:uncharacterized protein LOC132388804 [Hypanus sabinus]|uniref:uncharacterized protein LOC132388804 n=1 Tax=Hypanus sabinus TaxID=79690 RepID=UPI0028C3B647|nr:uncharacterized protein LOC132388804 [Hypanus sabinus]
MDHTPGGTAWNITRNEKNTFWMVPYILAEDDWLTVDYRMMSVFITIQVIFFPVLAIIALPVNTVTIFILSRGKCGLSRVVTCYLVAMAVADILVLILDLILSKIPLMYTPYLVFVLSMPKVCNIQAALIYTVTDCSVWFTVTFTFDRFVAICCQKLKTKYCTGKTAGVVLGTVTAISCLKNIYWYLRLSEIYTWSINPFICKKRDYYLNFTSEVDLFYYFLTPVFPFLLVLVTNVFTVRHVLVTSRTRRRLRVPGNGQSVRDPEMEKRRKSLVLLLIVSGNFILLWAPFTVFSAWDRICDLTNFVLPPESLRELGIILQLLSCLTGKPKFPGIPDAEFLFLDAPKDHEEESCLPDGMRQKPSVKQVNGMAVIVRKTSERNGRLRRGMPLAPLFLVTEMSNVSHSPRLRITEDTLFSERSRQPVPTEQDDIRYHLWKLKEAGIISKYKSASAFALTVARKKNRKLLGPVELLLLTREEAKMDHWHLKTIYFGKMRLVSLGQQPA